MTSPTGKTTPESVIAIATSKSVAKGFHLECNSKLAAHRRQHSDPRIAGSSFFPDASASLYRKKSPRPAHYTTSVSWLQPGHPSTTATVALENIACLHLRPEEGNGGAEVERSTQPPRRPHTHRQSPHIRPLPMPPAHHMPARSARRGAGAPAAPGKPPPPQPFCQDCRLPRDASHGHLAQPPADLAPDLSPHHPPRGLPRHADAEQTRPPRVAARLDTRTSGKSAGELPAATIPGFDRASCGTLRQRRGGVESMEGAAARVCRRRVA